MTEVSLPITILCKIIYMCDNDQSAKNVLRMYALYDKVWFYKIIYSIKYDVVSRFPLIRDIKFAYHNIDTFVNIATYISFKERFYNHHTEESFHIYDDHSLKLFEDIISFYSYKLSDQKKNARFNHLVGYKGRWSSYSNSYNITDGYVKYHSIKLYSSFFV